MKVLLVSMAMLATTLHAASQKPKLVKDINLNGIITEKEDLQPSSHSVQAVAFSPDEKWIAVGVGIHRKSGPPHPGEQASHLIVVPLDETIGHGFQVDPGTWITTRGLIWAPNSKTVLINTDSGPKWYAIPGGELWKQGQPDPRLQMVVGFVERDLAMAYPGQAERYRSQPDAAPSVVYVFNLMGRVVDEWKAPALSWFAAVNFDRHLVAVSEDMRIARAPFPIYLYPSKVIVQRWSQEKTFGWPTFAEAGKSMCGFGNYGRDVPYATCWDIDTGKKIAEFKGFPGGDPASVSSHASRIILTHVRNYRGTTEEFDMHSYRDRVVWDFRTDKEVAEWVPMTQVTETGLRPPEDKRTEFGPSVISPSGRYIAEGSNGLLRIYELP